MPPSPRTRITSKRVLPPSACARSCAFTSAEPWPRVERGPSEGGLVEATHPLEQERFGRRGDRSRRRLEGGIEPEIALVQRDHLVERGLAAERVPARVDDLPLGEIDLAR